MFWFDFDLLRFLWRGFLCVGPSPNLLAEILNASPYSANQASTLLRWNFAVKLILMLQNVIPNFVLEIKCKNDIDDGKSKLDQDPRAVANRGISRKLASFIH